MGGVPSTNPSFEPVHQSHGLFDLAEVIASLLGYRWQHECVIIPDYTNGTGRPDDHPRCVIMHQHPDGTQTFLRYSRGPGTGTGWDNYGDDFLCPELALVELAKAPPPPRVGVVIPTYGKPYQPYPEDLS